MAKTRFFRVAVEGATADGREITRADIEQMAASYNPATYAARVNMEHLRGYSPEPPFNAYGDVLAVKAEDITLELGGKSEKRLALFAQIEPTDQLKAINANKQKLFTSVEIAPNFAKSGGAYLVGLAVTDSPASLGTEMLQFAAGRGEANPLASRKLDPANLFTATAEDLVLDLTEEAPAAPAPQAGPSLFSQVLAALGGGGVAEAFAKLSGGQAAPEPAPAPAAVQPITPPAAANDNAEQYARGLAAVTTLVEAEGKARGDAFTKLEASVAKLTAQLETTEDPAQPRRPAATGGTGFSRTDC